MADDPSSESRLEYEIIKVDEESLKSSPANIATTTTTAAAATTTTTTITTNPTTATTTTITSSCTGILLEIGRLRFNVWKNENSIKDDLFPDKVWVDDLDYTAHHWIARSSRSGAIIGASRLTLHHSLDDDYRDVQLWRRAGKDLPLPTTDLGRLVVDPEFRCRGIAQEMNKLRVEFARALGAKSVMVTASEANARLLRKIGFEDIGQTIEFSDRPRTLFVALQLNF